ncbi:CBU_0592 family membrane protein [Spartinivicinus ruber]
MNWIFDGIGLIGVGCILIAYSFITLGKVTAESINYHLINIAGSILVLISLSWTPNLASIVIEVCWIVIGGYGVYKILKSRKF